MKCPIIFKRQPKIDFLARNFEKRGNERNPQYISTLIVHTLEKGLFDGINRLRGVRYMTDTQTLKKANSTETVLVFTAKIY